MTGRRVRYFVGATIIVALIISIHSISRIAGINNYSKRNDANRLERQPDLLADTGVGSRWHNSSCSKTLRNTVILPRQDRIYCMIPYLWKTDENRGRKYYDMLMGTFGEHCDTIKFFIDPVPMDVESSLPSNVIQIHDLRRRYNKSSLCGLPPHEHSCRHLFEKVWRMFVWVAEHDGHKAEWYIKLDEDSYFIPANLRRFVRLAKWNPDDLKYFGNQARHRTTPIGLTPFALGAGVGFSRGLLMKSKDIWKKMPYKDTFSTDTCADINGQTEDLATAVCLRQHLNVWPENMTIGGRETFLPFPPLSMLKMLRSKNWYWENRDKRTKDGQACCSHWPIVFHGLKRLGEHNETHLMLYTKTTVPQPKELLDYYKTVATNLRILETTLVVSYSCLVNLQLLTVLLRSIFPERILDFHDLNEHPEPNAQIRIVSVEDKYDCIPIDYSTPDSLKPFTIQVSGDAATGSKHGCDLHVHLSSRSPTVVTGQLVGILPNSALEYNIEELGEQIRQHVFGNSLHAFQWDHINGERVS